MAFDELREAVRLLFRIPLLWIPGMVGGAFAAIIWLSFFYSGAFFTSRLLVIFALVLLFFTTGMLAVIRNNEATGRALLTGGLNNFFRVSSPQIVIFSVLILVFILCTITVCPSRAHLRHRALVSPHVRDHDADPDAHLLF